MRAVVIWAALGAGMLVATASAQAQQSPLDGPLAAPGEAASAPAANPAKPKAKPHKAHHAKAKPVREPAEAQDAAVPRQPGETPSARATAPADAVDLGMKWNGNNDTAAQTRFQNGPNNAFGSGAEVGMKLHF
ncbi:exported protein of unknown function [Beijerinckiaceae bacterium RH AL1]|nr:hypothetical protein [Beijerinckiaceae bacterium]VVB45265.1 exported protein of unknown function [Beijerinckiaceae bacterium RH CH11]VVB45343.1 exported protein of unknown function [Beijerinckiaceae bacterium RH AL8]VVC54778.1 exported protein of unknown function [Beijerinckiaceae bacterium RH AL1]